MTSELTTTRDFLRYAVSRFRAAKLVHGHGTTSVIDEAAFLILETLHLPVGDINPWLDATLLPLERKQLFDIIEVCRGFIAKEIARISASITVLVEDGHRD